MELGIVVLDSNVVRQLEDTSVRNRVVRGLRSEGLAIRPTALSLLELAVTPDEQLRYRLLDTMADLSDSAPVRPMPTKILELTGRTIAADKVGFSWPASGLEALLYERGIGHDEVIVAARTLLAEQQAEFQDALIRARPHLRQAVARHGSADPWGSIPEFLDRQWRRMDFLQSEIRSAWTELELPGEANVARLLRDEAWRLFFEPYGATVYERAIRAQSQRPLHFVDCRQLIYLAGARTRVLVTDDGPLLRVAHGVLDGRYPAARVMTSSKLLALAS